MQRDDEIEGHGIGDSVMLISGGPPMKVIDVGRATGKLFCEWNGHGNEMCGGIFPRESLVGVPSFGVGDRVVLKCGSSPMTVIDVGSYTEQLFCEWQDDEGETRCRGYHPDLLVRIDAAAA